MKIPFANLFANFLAKASMGILTFLFLPQYLKIIGAEGYGLIGFYNLLSSLIVLFDFGLSNAMNREAARCADDGESKIKFLKLVRTTEIVYLLLSFLIVLITCVGSGFIANYWIKPVDLSAKVIQQSIWLMGFSLGILWPSTLYSNILMGMQKQVFLNVIVISSNLFRHLITLALLWFVSSDIWVFFSCQIIVNLLQTTATAFYFWRKQPRIAPAFSWVSLKPIARYATGISLLSILSLILTTVDKVILSKMLSLTNFGYYTLASSLALSLYMIISPIFSAYFPIFTQCVAKEDREGFLKAYHLGAQIMSVALLPIGLILVFFSRDVLQILTQNIEIAEAVYPIASVLILGTLCNGIMNIPFAAQLAYGSTRLAISQNIVSIIILIPLTIWSVKQFGAIGASYSWLIHNLGSLLLMFPAIHRRFGIPDTFRGFIYDIGLPFVVCVSIVWIAKYIFTPSLGIVGKISFLTCATTGAYIISGFFSPLVRSRLKDKLSEMRTK